MATITYNFVDRCEGGGHVRFDVLLNLAATRRVVYTTDEIRAPLGEMTDDEIRIFTSYVMRVHMAGKTRQQINDEVTAGPVTVTI